MRFRIGNVSVENREWMRGSRLVTAAVNRSLLQCSLDWYRDLGPSAVVWIMAGGD
jgi:hypothetical protein